MGIIQYQPFKAIYILTSICVELCRLPLWLIKYVLPYGRPHPKWSFKQALGVRFLSSMIRIISDIQIKTRVPLTPGVEKDQFVVIEPAAENMYKGPLTPSKHVKPVRIGGTWYPEPLKTTGGSDMGNVLVVLHIHGGAYVHGNGRKEGQGFFSHLQRKHGGATHIFVPQYRLSCLPASPSSNPFPAALQDSLTSYLYLVDTLKISPTQIILSGDSAGGNAAVAILKYLTNFGQELNIPNPSAAWLWSPWLDPSASTTDAWTRTNPHYATDYLSFAFSAWGSHAYAGPGGLQTLQHPYANFKKPEHLFRTPVPLWVSTCGCEVLYFDDVEWAEGMKGEGNSVELDVEPYAVHDAALVGNVIGFTNEARGMVKRAGEWYKGLDRKDGAKL